MTESDGAPSADEFRRLEQSIKDLRQELELSHHQQAYLQMQITALTDAKSEIRGATTKPKSILRAAVIRIVKRNALLWKLATRVSRYLHR